MQVVDEIKEIYKDYSCDDLLRLFEKNKSITPLPITRIMKTLNKTKEEVDDYIVKYELGIEF